MLPLIFLLGRRNFPDFSRKNRFQGNGIQECRPLLNAVFFFSHFYLIYYCFKACFRPDLFFQDKGFVTTQILFVLFVFFISIVLVNLLVGLTVSKTEELFKEAGIYRLEKTILQVFFVSLKERYKCHGNVPKLVLGC